MTAVPSPCTTACRLDADDTCIGCGRTLDEIAEWSRADFDRKRVIAASAAARLAGPAASRRAVA